MKLRPIPINPDIHYQTYYVSRRRASAWTFRPDHYMLILPLDPGGSIRAGETGADFAADHFVLIPPGVQAVVRLSYDQLRQFYLHFQTRLNYRGPQSLFLFPASSGHRQRVADLRMLSHQISLSEAYQESHNVRAALLAVSLAAEAMLQIPAEALERAPSDRRIDDVLEYIEKNLTAKLSNQALARMADLDEESFMRQFQLCSGYTPHAYVIHRRIDRAYELLIHSRMSIAEIARTIGFSDRFSFSHAFKKSSGMGPAEFRRVCSVAGGES